MKQWPHPRDEFLEKWKSYIPISQQDNFKKAVWELYEDGRAEVLRYYDDGYDGDGG